MSSLSLQDLYNLVVTPDSFVLEITNNVAKCWVREAASEGLRMQMRVPVAPWWSS